MLRQTMIGRVSTPKKPPPLYFLRGILPETRVIVNPSSLAINTH